MTFDWMTPVLHCGPDSWPLRYSEGRRWLLWPALAFQVIAPVPREQPFNLFQEYVIKLCRAGIKSTVEIGARLGFGAELAAFIVLELQHEGYLDDHGVPTLSAVRELEDAEAHTDDAVSGYVFQDPFTGNLWPRFVIGSLPRAGVEKLPKDDPAAKTLRFDLVVGTAGKPEYPKAAAILPAVERTGAGLAPPSALAILAACRDQRRQRKNHQRACGRELDRASSSAAFDLPAYLEQVSLVSPAQPVFLTTFVFVPEDATGGGCWQVCDPFGLGPSLTLRKQIEGMVAQFPEGPLTAVIEQVTGSSYAVNPVDLAEILAGRHRDAAEVLERDLGPEIRKYPALFGRLLETEKARADASLHAGKSGGSQKEYQSRLKDYFVRAYAALEELCAAVLAQYPAGDDGPPAPGEAPGAGDTLAALSAVGEENSELLGEIAERVGFVDADSAFPGFFRMTRAQAKGVTTHGRRELRLQFGVMLAVARDVPDHPLFRLATAFPDCVRFLRDLKHQRDTGAHAMAGSLVEHTDPVRNGIYRCVRALLPGIRTAPASERGEAGVAQDLAAVELIHHRLRARAALHLEQRLGPDIRERRELYRYLVEMQTRLEELRVSAGQDGLGDRELVAASFLIKGCSALEAALQGIAQAYRPAAGIPPLDRDKRVNAPRFIQAARTLGFELERNSLPETLVTVQADRVEKTLRTGSGTLNALTLALLLAADHDRDHPFRLVASVRPSFLLDIARLTARRGHGDRLRLDPGEVEPVAETILALVEAVLPYAA